MKTNIAFSVSKIFTNLTSHLQYLRIPTLFNLSARLGISDSLGGIN